MPLPGGPRPREEMIRVRQSAGRRLLVGFAGLACALQATAAEVVRTVHPSRDVVIAERVLCPEAGAGDSVRIQRAIEETARLGGGTVFLAAGTYRIDAPLMLRRGVTLRGDYAPAKPAESTVLAIIHGEGDEEGMAAVSVEHGSGLSGLVFHYPDQRLEAPKPYPWTVRTAIRSAGNNQTVEDVQMNPHYVYRRPGDHPLTEPKESGRGEPAFILYQREHLTGLSFADCADERISGTFLYAARSGIVFSGRMNASVLIHGTDTAAAPSSSTRRREAAAGCAFAARRARREGGGRLRHDQGQRRRPFRIRLAVLAEDAASRAGGVRTDGARPVQRRRGSGPGAERFGGGGLRPLPPSA